MRLRSQASKRSSEASFGNGGSLRDDPKTNKLRIKNDSRGFRCRINFAWFQNQWKSRKVKQQGSEWDTWLSARHAQFNRISNQYFPESLGSRVLFEEEEVSWLQIEVIPRYRRPLVNNLLYVSLLCSRDYLQVTNEKNRVFGKYCGHMTGKTLLVSGKYALIKFHSESRIQNRGFLISFTSCKKDILEWSSCFNNSDNNFKMC